MIDKNATHEAFGYWPNELKPHSNKFIIATCELCGEFKIVPKWQYSPLCYWCLLSQKRIARICKMCGKEFEVLPSIAKRDKGKYCSRTCWSESRSIGGHQMARARSHAKRTRQLGYTLLMPLKEGGDGHHVTNEYVIGIPEDIHNSIGGRRRKHRMLVLQWLKVNDKKKYKMVLYVLAMDSLN